MRLLWIGSVNLVVGLLALYVLNTVVGLPALTVAAAVIAWLCLAVAAVCLSFLVFNSIINQGDKDGLRYRVTPDDADVSTERRNPFKSRTFVFGLALIASGVMFGLLINFGFDPLRVSASHEFGQWLLLIPKFALYVAHMMVWVGVFLSGYKLISAMIGRRQSQS